MILSPSHRDPRRPIAACLACVCMLLAACGGPEGSVAAADLVVLDADVHTADTDRPRARALAVRDGRFVAVGEAADVEALIDDDTRVVDADGATVLPGLIDGHVNVESGFDLVRGVNLYGVVDPEEWLERIARRAGELAEGTWIVGGRWDHTLSGSVLPTRGQLDAVAPDHPVALVDVDAHSMWVNSLALRRAGIDADTPDPDGGEILRDPDTGEPTGILLEAAMGPVARLAPPVPADERPDAYRRVFRLANSLGLTGLHAFPSLEDMPEYLRLLEAGDATVRVWMGAAGLALEELEELRRMQRRIQRQTSAISGSPPGPMLGIGFVNFGVDGVLSTRTAALLEPYADAPGRTGRPDYTQQELDRIVATVNAAGFGVSLHAIGDRAVRMAIRACAASPEAGRVPNRIEHLEAVHPADLDALARSGATASMNPHHCISGIDKYNTARLGPERASRSFPWKPVLEAGVPLVLGSDWPTAPLAPLQQIYAAVLRQKPSGGPPGGWYPDNALDFPEALRGLTVAPAELAGWDGEIGSITVGKAADFVILDAPIADPVDRTILDRDVAATYLAGGRVYPDR